VLRVDRSDAADRDVVAADLLARNRRSVAIDLKQDRGAQTVLRLVERADALIEGFRPGVVERLGLGPDVCLERNPRLVYGRVTGWGQNGPLARLAGHDINYIALTGALHAIGRPAQAPVPPLNLVGDFGGGGMLAAFGIVCGLFEAMRSGEGQVVDAAMVDGAALLMTAIFSLQAAGLWSGGRGGNLLDGGAPFYDVYLTADDEYVALGAIEPQFYRELSRLAGLGPLAESERWDAAQWPDQKERVAAIFKTKTRAEWCELLAGTDACFAPVLSMTEAPTHPHNALRQTFVDVDGIVQPAPAPRFSRTPGAITLPPPSAGEHTDEALRDWGFDQAEIDKLHAHGTITRGGASGDGSRTVRPD
jgi:alpha-methylacyl-CoA racemase